MTLAMIDSADDRIADSLEAEADNAAAAGNPAAARRVLAQVTTSYPGRTGAWLKLAATCRATGDLPGALAAVSGALRVDPLGLMPLLLKANLLQEAGRVDEAGEAYGHALAQCPSDVPPHLKTPIERAERLHRDYVERTERALTAAAEPIARDLSSAQQKRIARFASNIVRRTRPYHSDPSHFHYPGLVEAEFHEPEQFPWIAPLEQAAMTIADEFRGLMETSRAELVPYIQYSEDQPLRQWKPLNWNKDWTAVHLLQNGEVVKANARHCPETIRVLEDVDQPRIPGRSPNAMFSLLAPGTRIPPHTGVANTRLVCHLPLVVPDDCWFRVGAETRRWEVGKAFVFDDTIEHEAANDSDQLRVVFIFDVWHPGLSSGEQRAVSAMMSKSVDDGGDGL